MLIVLPPPQIFRYFGRFLTHFYKVPEHRVNLSGRLKGQYHSHLEPTRHQIKIFVQLAHRLHLTRGKTIGVDRPNGGLGQRFMVEVVIQLNITLIIGHPPNAIRMDRPKHGALVMNKFHRLERQTLPRMAGIRIVGWL